MLELRCVPLLVKRILETPDAHRWTLQGLGMLRLYLSDALRLHVWDPRCAAPGASAVHDHPWDFSSLIVSGALTNRLLLEVPGLEAAADATHLVSRLHCGAGGGLVDRPIRTRLVVGSVRRYEAGQLYSQVATDVHETSPDPGTDDGVELVRERPRLGLNTFFGGNLGLAEASSAVAHMERASSAVAAQGRTSESFMPTPPPTAPRVLTVSAESALDKRHRVFWPVDTEWGSAEPRCDACGGRIATGSYLLRVSLLVVNPVAAREVLFAPDSEPVKVAGDIDPALQTELIVCQDCVLFKPFDLALLLERRNAGPARACEPQSRVIPLPGTGGDDGA